ncbi:MAG: RnfABCDGE type electron transport complex subunit B [Candidatus Omnitrophota bacterium]|jgi:RnfABCDGE-type electron transport complex B subunit
MKEIIVACITLGITGFAFALILAFLSRKLKVEEDPRITQIISLLPAANCGACGFAGCRGFAQAVINEGKIFSGCIPGGHEINEKIAKIIGVKGGITLKQKTAATCRCGAQLGEKKESSVYSGPFTCQAAHITGSLDCAYGCLSYGDCIKACPTGAITLKSKKIYVEVKKCIACGKCVEVCPRKLFELVPILSNIGVYNVCCNNNEKLNNIKKVCSRGCIACGLCTRVNDSPYYLKDNLSRIDFTKAKEETPLREGKEKCPTRCIFKLE